MTSDGHAFDQEALRQDPEFNHIMGELIDEALLEQDITDAQITSITIERLVGVLEQHIPMMEQQLEQEHPEESTGPGHFRDEAIRSTVALAFSAGFRVGRMFNARGYEINH